MTWNKKKPPDRSVSVLNETSLRGAAGALGYGTAAAVRLTFREGRAPRPPPRGLLRTHARDICMRTRWMLVTRQNRGKRAARILARKRAYSRWPVCVAFGKRAAGKPSLLPGFVNFATGGGGIREVLQWEYFSKVCDKLSFWGMTFEG